MARGLIVIWIAGLVGLAGCALPRPAGAPAVYDFGPGVLQVQPATRMANLPPLELGEIKASAAFNGTAVLYRLAYADTQQLKPYTLARWSMPPAQLIEQRLRAQLGQRRAVMPIGDIALVRPPFALSSAPVSATGSSPLQPQVLLGLHLELEEFSQIFETAEKSFGTLRLRATATQRSAAGESLLAQRAFTAHLLAPVADAPGGVHALTSATDQVVQDIEMWLAQVERAGTAP